MVSFIHNGSNIFKTNGTKSKSKQKDKNIIFESQAEDHQISTRTLELYANSLKQLFYGYIYEKKYLAVDSSKGCFCQFVDRNIVSSKLKYYLLAGDTTQVSIFFPCKR